MSDRIFDYSRALWSIDLHITIFFMGLFSGLFEVATAPLSIVADVVTLGNAGERKSFTRQKAEAIDEAFRD